MRTMIASVTLSAWKRAPVQFVKKAVLVKHMSYKEISTKKEEVWHFENDEPSILLIMASGTRGYYHVIKDEPGPSFEHWFLSKADIWQYFEIQL